MPDIYVTKYALKKGVIRTHVAPVDIKGENVIVYGAYPWDTTVLKLGEWYLDLEKAKARAKQLAVQEANKLERRAGELRGMDFEPSELRI